MNTLFRLQFMMIWSNISVLWGLAPHGIWHGASHKLNPALHIDEAYDKH